MHQLEIKDSIRQGERLALADFVPPLLQSMVASCWNENPKSRPSFSDLHTSLNSIMQHIKETEESALPKSLISFESQDESVLPTDNIPKSVPLEKTNINKVGKSKELDNVQEHKPIQNVPPSQMISTVAAPTSANLLQTPAIKSKLYVEKTPGKKFRSSTCFSSRKQLFILGIITILFICILTGVFVALLVRPASKEIEQSQTTTATTLATKSPLPSCDVEKVVKLNTTACKTTFPSTIPISGNRLYREYVDGDSTTRARFLSTNGIGVHPDGSIIVADQNRMRGIQGSSTFTRPFLNSGLSLKQFSLDSNGTMYVPVASRYIVAVNTTSNVETIIAGNISSSGFLDSSDPLKAKFVNPIQTLYHQKKLYILDRLSTTSAAIRLIDFCTHTLNPGVQTILNFTDPAQQPQAMALDEETLFYSTNNHCIDKFFLANKTTVTCFVGTPGVPGSTDGPSGVGRLSNPFGLLFDKCGKLFVTEQGYIRSVDNAGNLTTVGYVNNSRPGHL